MKPIINLSLLIGFLSSLTSFETLAATGSLTPIKSFDWGEVMEIPSKPNEHVNGYQILHFKTTNKPFTADYNAKLFVEKNFITAKAFFSDAEVLKYTSSVAHIPNGFYLEMGVATGRSVNFLAALNPTKIIYGFDSFEGLPKQWTRGDKNMRAGMFALKNPNFQIPLLNNVKVYKGRFKDVLPKFKEQVLKHNPIALLHIDSDLYESAHEVLHILKNNIVSGTVIIFDEFYNYPGCENHEMKAFREFVKKRDLEYEFIAYNQFHEQVAVRIK